MADVLYCSKSINKVRLNYGQDLILFKKQKEGAAGVLIYVDCSRLNPEARGEHLASPLPWVDS